MLIDSPWLSNVSNSVWQWLTRMRVPERPGWVRFSQDGALLEPGARSGLGISCLALKTCAMLGLTSRLSQGELEGWIAHI